MHGIVILHVSRIPKQADNTVDLVGEEVYFERTEEVTHGARLEGTIMTRYLRASPIVWRVATVVVYCIFPHSLHEA